MKRHLDASRINHEIGKFQNWLSKEYPDIDEDMSREAEQRILKQIRWILSIYVHPQSSISQRHLAQALLREVPAYQDQSEGYYAKFSDNLLSDTSYLPFENSNLQAFNVQSFKAWYFLVQKHSLQTYPAFVLLGCFICESRNQVANRYIISELTQFDLEVVDKHLETLSQIGLVTLMGNGTEHPKQFSISSEYILKPNPDSFTAYDKWDHDFCDQSEALFAEQNLLQNVSELDLFSYLITNQAPLQNPFVVRTGQAEIYAHEQLMRPLVIATALLSRDQITTWLSKAYAAKPGRVLKRLKDELNVFILNFFNRPSHPDKHFDQILRVMPLLHYIARRTFNVDWEYQARLVASTLQMRMDEAHYDFKATQSIPSTGDDCDVDVFLKCLTQPDPPTEWSKQYPDTPITFQKGLFPSKSSPQIVLNPGEWSVADINNLPHDILGFDELNRFLKANGELQQLIKYMTRMKRHGFTSLQFHIQVLSVKTHRIYFVDPSSQNIPQSLRSIFKAQANHQFLMVDISEMELSIIKHLAGTYPLEADEKDIKDLTFNSLCQDTGFSRERIKTFLYPYVYGAAKDTLLNDVGLIEAEMIVLKNALSQYPQYAAFEKDINRRTRVKGFSPPTPLGFSIPVRKMKSYAGLSYLIQSTGAEIFREWILAIHRDGLSPYLVNLIHDEIILEISVEMNLYDVTNRLDECLQVAANNILPTLHFGIKAFSGKCWDKANATEIILNR